ncbi:MAG: hypothetical protein DIU61_010445 [Bacteroidota bacterium]|jgi:hypothetical protein|nr:hypothetical protein [Cyclobacteriaceae bacterium]
MQNGLKTLVFVILALTTFSCQQDDAAMPSERIDRKGIEQFIRLVDLSVEALERQRPEDVSQAADIIVGKIPELEARLGIDLRMRNDRRGSSTGRLPASVVKSAARVHLEQKIVSYSRASTSAEDYLRRLALLKSEILSSRNITGVERAELLTLVSLNEEFVRYLDRKVSEISNSGGLVLPAAKCSGWWSCWGKCVAGAVGGAGLGALTGAAYGGVGCTMVLPVVGTVACGSVGLVAGGIFGGLAGAAASCD